MGCNSNLHMDTTNATLPQRRISDSKAKATTIIASRPSKERKPMTTGKRILRRLGKSPGITEHAVFWWPFVILMFFLCTESILNRIILFSIGAFAQSFIEYASHAWFFHGPLWGMHRGHHKTPGDDGKLLVPLAYSITAGGMAFAAFWFMCGINILAGLASGAAFWYIVFEYIHYASHNPPSLKPLQKISWFKELQSLHKLHHYEDKDGKYKYYGFTTTFWDRVFGTI